ncbi:MAG: hypothetical protein JW940_18605 [Polyangiaceae bacterium]|nr:hypothetical protein [Polyangiaceae bacterium]
MAREPQALLRPNKTKPRKKNSQAKPSDLEAIGRHSDPRYVGLTVLQYGALIAAVAAGWVWLLRWRTGQRS